MGRGLGAPLACLFQLAWATDEKFNFRYEFEKNLQDFLMHHLVELILYEHFQFLHHLFNK